MGLDISCYSDVKLIETTEATEPEELWSSGYHNFWVNRDFPEYADDISTGWYSVEGHTSFRAGSYSGYNNWRRTLCKIVHGVDPEELWANLEEYRDKPFFELINFSDCEGIIGPKTAAKLANDFDEYRELVASSRLVEGYRGDDYWLNKYDEWREGFHFAAKTGVVQFH